ncbi:MAG: YIP1 family protein [Calditrichaeota bacterium]|nr:MAG: YIP1 family protein [Calditrichota bacterium]
MQESISEPTGTQPATRTNQISRMIGVLFAPGETMKNIASQPTWVFPLVIIILVSVASGYLLQDLVWQRALEQIQNNPNVTQQQLEISEKITRISTWAAPVLAVPIMYLIIAGLFLFTGNVLLGGEARFKTAFSVVCWSGMVSVLGAIVTIPIMRSRGELTSITSLTFLAPGADIKSATYFILSQLDLFYVWWVAVLGVGMAAVYNFPIKKGIMTVAAWWVFYILVVAGIKALF